MSKTEFKSEDLKTRVEALEEKVAINTNSLTILSPNITVGSRNGVYKRGQWMYISAVLSITGNIAQASNLFYLPYNSIGTIYFDAHIDSNNTSILLTIDGDRRTVKNELGILQNGTVLRLGVAIPCT